MQERSEDGPRATTSLATGFDEGRPGVARRRKAESNNQYKNILCTVGLVNRRHCAPPPWIALPVYRERGGAAFDPVRRENEKQPGQNEEIVATAGS